MIEKWKVSPYSSELHPGRYRVYVRCSAEDIKKIMDFFKNKAGQPWKLKDAEFNFSFYLNDIPDDEAGLIEKKLEGLKNKAAREEYSTQKASPDPADKQRKSPDKLPIQDKLPEISEKKSAAGEVKNGPLKKELKAQKNTEVQHAEDTGNNFILNSGEILAAEVKEKESPLEGSKKSENPVIDNRCAAETTAVGIKPPSDTKNSADSSKGVNKNPENGKNATALSENKLPLPCKPVRQSPVSFDVFETDKIAGLKDKGKGKSDGK